MEENSNFRKVGKTIDVCTKKLNSTERTTKIPVENINFDENYVSQNECLANAYMPHYPDPKVQGYNQLYQNQNVLLGMVQEVGRDVEGMRRCLRKTYRKVVDAAIQCNKDGQWSLELITNDRVSDLEPFFSGVYGPPTIYTISIMKERYLFVTIVIPGGLNSITLEVSEIKGMNLYNAFVRAGLKINPTINTKWVAKALNDYVLEEVELRSQLINLSGLAGWEDGEFKSAESVEYLKRYQYKMKLPVFKKALDRNVLPNVMPESYMTCMSKIRDNKHRVLFALLPFAGIMYSVLEKQNRNIPFVLNLILMDEQLSLREIVQYFQVFNRDRISALSVNDTDKCIKTVLGSSKDEVLCFVGLHHEEDTLYADKKITNNLNHIAKKALNRSGLGFGENVMQSKVVLISNERIAQRGVHNMFVDKDFFDNNVENVYAEGDPIHAILASFVNYVEVCQDYVLKIIAQEFEASCSEECYWRTLIRLVNKFWMVLGMSLSKVLNLSEDFKYDFLWEQDECYLEDSADTLIKAIRHAVSYLKPVQRKNSTGYDGIVVDEKYILITSDALSMIVEKEGLHGQKERLLLGAKEEGLLQVSEYGGFTTKIQINHIRREYYRFHKHPFNKVGMVDVFE